MALSDLEAAELLGWLRAEHGLDEAAADLLRGVAHAERAPLEEVALTMGAVEEGPLLRFMAGQLDLPFHEALPIDAVEAALVERHGAPFFLARSLAPVRLSDGRVALATSRPADSIALQEAAFVLDGAFAAVVVPSAAIRQALRERDEPGEAKAAGPLDSRSAQTVRKRFQDAAQGGTVARQIEAVVADALERGASDIHVEAAPGGARARLRVQGVLQPYALPAGFDADAAVARLKTLGGMSVTERRLPQDGRATVVFDGRSVELRLSSIPTHHGESLVARVLDPKALRRGWDALGFEPGVIERLTALIERPSGLFIVAGPTGSGKTTTLYTALAHLNDGRRKLISVEDPVEYDLPGVEQVQVNPQVGLTFAAVLRAALRQDPDILMVGEIRDEETAEIAARAALIGRLVLATIHTGSPEAVRTRLVDLGVPAYLVDDVLLGVLSQRLQVAACEPCAGQGCQACRWSGLGTRKPEVRLVEYAGAGVGVGSGTEPAPAAGRAAEPTARTGEAP